MSTPICPQKTFFKKVSLILITFFILISIFCCAKNSKYGLVSSDGDYGYSYFVTDSELYVKNIRDFEKQFETDEYMSLKKQVEKSEEYLQAEVVFLPIVQRIIHGDKYVFVFESIKEHSDYIAMKRLAFECDQLKDLEFPSNCRGYFMEDGGDWPPDFYDIIKGQITVIHNSAITGILVGDIEIVLDNQKKISGKFRIYDKNKFLFLNSPAY